MQSDLRQDLSINLKWEKDRWATTRTCNVKELYDRWSNEPTRAEVLIDPKLKDDHLVIMKKKQLDSIISRNEYLSKKASEAEVLLQTVDLIAKLASSNQPDAASMAVNLLSSLRKNFVIN